MTARQVDLCVAILEDHFGFYVARVGSVLLREQIPLALLAQKLAPLRISAREVKRSVAILAQHNLLQIEAGGRGPVYSVLAEEVCQLIRAPRAILVIKTLYDAVAEAIFEDILARGQSSCSACIRRVAKCLDNLEFNKIKIEFVRLAEAQILKRCPQLAAEESTPSNPVFQAVPDPFLMPDVILDGKDYEKGIESLCFEHIESTIREKIGDKAVRIFRLLRLKGFLEEEQVEKEAMLSAKETKELCCALMDNGFITTRQAARSNDSRTIFLYTVNMSHALNSLIQFTTGAIRNVIRRRMLEREKHEPLLDRQLKMEVIINSIQNQPAGSEEDEEARKEQIAEVEQAYMTPDDKRQLERFKCAERRFCATEIELERALFALRHFQQLRQRINVEQQKIAAETKGPGRRRRTAVAVAALAVQTL